MQAKSVLYAAVGAPVVAARKVTDQVNGLKGRVSKETSNYTEVANKAIDGWATEGEKVVSRISEGKVVEEISSKVDLDQAKEQVGKLRDQLEDMLATWRTSFRPEKPGPADKSSADEKPAAKSTAAKKPAAKKPAAKTSAAKTASTKGGSSSTAAKTSTAKSTPAKAKAS
jgi:hypothetical protein